MAPRAPGSPRPPRRATPARNRPEPRERAPEQWTDSCPHRVGKCRSSASKKSNRGASFSRKIPTRVSHHTTRPQLDKQRPIADGKEVRLRTARALCLLAVLAACAACGDHEPSNVE